MVEEGVAQAALRMAGEFAVAEREVSRADGDVRNGKRVGEGAEERCVAARDVGERGARVEGEDQGDAEAAGAEDDGSPSGVATEDRDVADRAGFQVRPGVRGAIARQNDGGMRGFPDEQALPSSKAASRVAGVDTGAPGALDACQNLPFLAESPGGRHQTEVGQLHGGWRYNPGN